MAYAKTKGMQGTAGLVLAPYNPLYSNLGNQEFDALRRLLIAGVFFDQQRNDNDVDVLPDRIDRHAKYANANMHCGSVGAIRVGLPV